MRLSMNQEDEPLELFALRYARSYEHDYGIRPTYIHISRYRLEKHEVKHGINKLDYICGMKVLSHTYPEKYDDSP